MKPGMVVPTSTPSEPFESFEHSFITLTLIHVPTQRKILSILDQSSSDFDFQHRLIAEGFDLAAPSPAIETAPIGRCWRLVSGSKVLLGVLWDTPGRLGSLVSGLSVSDIHPSVCHPV